MRPAHTRHRKDGNHVEIRNALMAVGATVHESDWVDLIAGYRGRTYLIEVKTARGGLRPHSAPCGTHGAGSTRSSAPRTRR